MVKKKPEPIGDEEKEELKSQYLRALADYQNLERRTQEEKAVFARYALKEFLEKLLVILDDLEKAADHLNDRGILLTLGKLKDLLADEGLKEINPEKGADFDSGLMEVIEVVEEPNLESGKVAEVLSKGYFLNGKMLRPARVVVKK